MNIYLLVDLSTCRIILDMFYSLDGKKWIKAESSLDVSGFHHNALSGFMNLRIGLVALGNGTVHFKNYSYEALPD